MKIGIAGAVFAVFLVLFVASQANAHVLLVSKKVRAGRLSILFLTMTRSPVKNRLCFSIRRVPS